MTATADQTGTSNANVVLAAAADSGISRLNASDGLFLRAEHLQRMQDYGRELALSVGLATGPGVAYGYPVALSGTTLTVGKGLAIDPSGRPLRSTSTVELSLESLAVENDRFWVVQVTKGWPRLSGAENVYGSLCDDPCSPATIQPWADEGVIVQVVADSFEGLSVVNPPSGRRNWLASRYFERERAAGGPWLVPGADGPSLSRPWSNPTPQPDAGAVPIAVLLRVGEQWVLDVWTARRDIGDPPPQRDWRWRLGLRPWNVFSAQVLQFQAQLADVAAAAGRVHADEERAKLIDEALAAFNALTVKPRKLGKALADLQGAEHLVAAPADLTQLPSQGFDELPPAGFLRQPPADVPDRDQFYADLFGAGVEVQVCDCAADFALRAVEQAQHLDRIPLAAVATSTVAAPKVDVLVPTIAADLPPVQVSGYGWAAFVRHREAVCGEQTAPTELVDVYIHAVLLPEDYQTAIDDAVAGRPPGDQPQATVTYPAGTWAVPIGDAREEVLRKWSASTVSEWAVVGLALSEDRRPLAMVRAALLATPVIDGEVSGPQKIYSAVPKGLTKEAIIVVILSTPVIT